MKTKLPEPEAPSTLVDAHAARLKKSGFIIPQVGMHRGESWARVMGSSFGQQCVVPQELFFISQVGRGRAGRRSGQQWRAGQSKAWQGVEQEEWSAVEESGGVEWWE